MNSKITLVVATLTVALIVIIGITSEPRFDVAGLDTISTRELLATGENFSLGPDETVAKLDKKSAPRWSELIQKADLRSKNGAESDLWIHPRKKGIANI